MTNRPASRMWPRSISSRMTSGTNRSDSMFGVNILATMTGPVDWRPMEKMAGYALTSDSNGDAW